MSNITLDRNAVVALHVTSVHVQMYGVKEKI